MKMTSPEKMMGFLPNRSEANPHRPCPIPSAQTKRVMVSVMCEGETWKSLAMIPSDGRFESTEKAPSEERIPQ